MTRSAAEQEAPMGKKTGYLLSSLLFLGLVAYIVYKVRTNSEWQNFDLAHFQATLGRLDYRILLIALTIVYSTYLLRSLRWREFLLPIKPTSVSNLLTATIIGFGGLVLLGRPGELVRPYLISRKEDMPVSTQMAVWVLERVYDLSMIVVIVGGVTYFSVWGEELSQGRTQALLHIRAAGLIILTLTLCGILGLVLFRCYWQSWVPRLLAPDPLPAAAPAGEGARAFGTVRAGTLQPAQRPRLPHGRALYDPGLDVDLGGLLHHAEGLRPAALRFQLCRCGTGDGFCHRRLHAAGAGNRWRHASVYHHRSDRIVWCAPRDGHQRCPHPVVVDLRRRGSPGLDLLGSRGTELAQAAFAGGRRVADFRCPVACFTVLDHCRRFPNTSAGTCYTDARLSLDSGVRSCHGILRAAIPHFTLL